ncbi:MULTISPECIES: ABC transporter ATP-binding protein [unclassified Streptomyces]|uniref:ABC transporter ATP-binding protein n=1 Tax=unclassified Streptomyces TaxID=2593676 RepID=UPI00336AB407
MTESPALRGAPAGPDRPEETADLLEVEGLTVTFPTTRGPVDVVRNNTFTLGRNETVGIVGESGSGKSMTALAVMGLLPRGARTSGSIRFRGTELLGRPDAELRRLRGNVMSMVFQDPLSSLNPYYTVGLQIAEVYRCHRGGSRRAARAMAIDALGRVGIPDPAERVDRYPHQFSGGQRQRIMIAMALICEPALLIADEPTTALDVTVQSQILELLAELKRQTGTGMLFITHDLAVIATIAQRVLVMREGEQLEYADTERVFSAPRHPYTRMLLESIPRIDDELAAPGIVSPTARPTRPTDPAPAQEEVR